MLVGLTLFGLAFSDSMLNAIKSAISDINRRFVLLSDFFVNDVPVLLE